jgi:hypothetical protein
MAICKFCSGEMHEVAGCILEPIQTVDGPLDPVKYGSEVDPEHPSHHGPIRRCGDCAALPGNYHHVGCDLEECPRCGGQLLSCDCVIGSDEETKVVQ